MIPMTGVSSVTADAAARKVPSPPADSTKEVCDTRHRSSSTVTRCTLIPRELQISLSLPLFISMSLQLSPFICIPLSLSLSPYHYFSLSLFFSISSSLSLYLSRQFVTPSSSSDHHPPLSSFYPLNSVLSLTSLRCFVSNPISTFSTRHLFF